ncbi:hypothetical protein AAFM79_20410 [Trichormus azollae HNT15244]
MPQGLAIDATLIEGDCISGDINYTCITNAYCIARYGTLMVKL